jgi:ribosomal protein S27AE
LFQVARSCPGARRQIGQGYNPPRAANRRPRDWIAPRAACIVIVHATLTDRPDMKTTGKCVKCGSSDIIRIPGRIRPYGAGNNIPVGITIFSSVKVTRFLCGGCGYSEEWVEAPADIDKVRKRYSGGA